MKNHKLKKSILIIDDDPDIVDALHLVLSKEGYTVYSSTDSRAIDELLIGNGTLPHLIILDLLLSGIEGTVIVKQLKGNDRTKDIPIIMFSAHPHAERKAVESGANEFLAKPFDIHQLIDLVNKRII